MQRRSVLSLFAAVVGATACGGSSGGPQDPTVLDLQNAQQRVEGSWRLVSFEPEKPLGPPFDTLVQDQLGQLQLTLGGGSLSASGAGFQATRSYEITQATGDAAQAAVFDDVGVRYEFDLFFQGNQLRFVSKTSPWRGQGILQRAG